VLNDDECGWKVYCGVGVEGVEEIAKAAVLVDISVSRSYKFGEK
jgi:hypothetical protein